MFHPIHVKFPFLWKKIDVNILTEWGRITLTTRGSDLNRSATSTNMIHFNIWKDNQLCFEPRSIHFSSFAKMIFGLKNNNINWVIAWISSFVTSDTWEMSAFFVWILGENNISEIVVAKLPATSTNNYFHSIE